jgi:hypothetical protein
MFERDPKDMALTLSEMERRSRERCNFNQAEARTKMAEWISQDARFSDLDPSRVAERVARCRSNGAVFDITDPHLRKGGQPRPPERRGRY